MTNLWMSEHAHARLSQRSKLKPLDAHKLIDKAVVIHTTLGIKGNIHHAMFYSEPDDRFYIAVVSIEGKEIVTVLYSEYHRQHYPDISQEQYDAAKESCHTVNRSESFVKRYGLGGEFIKPGKKRKPEEFVVKVNYFTGVGSNTKAKKVCTFDKEKFGYNVAELVERPIFRSRVKAHMERKSVSPNNVVCLYIYEKAGQQPPTIYQWDSGKIVPNRTSV